MFTATKILQIQKVGDIFTNDMSKMKKEFIDLCKIWHPDVNKSPQANDVMIKLNLLYNKAQGLIESNEWEKSNYLMIISAHNKSYEFKFIRELTLPLGKCYIGINNIMYVISDPFKQAYENGIYHMKSLFYTDSKMEEEFKRYVPNIIAEFSSNKHEHVMILTKTADQLLLKDVLDYYGHIPHRHVAWILSRLYSIACYLDHIGFAHNAITIDNCFISPPHHTISLLGGWWFVRKQGDNLIGIPKEIYKIMPPLIKENKISDIKTDLESIRFLGKQLLDINDPELPLAFKQWLNYASADNALKEFKRWQQVLTDSYGKRKFVKMDISQDILYKK